MGNEAFTLTDEEQQELRKLRKKLNKIKCYSCGRSPIVPGEGRVADGSWTDDVNLPEEAKGKWFCCCGCYSRELVKK